MDRITEKDLEVLVKRLNEDTNSPTMPWVPMPDGKMKARIGNYHISHAYGGVSLHRMTNEGGGVEDVFRCGHIPKRELYNRIHAYLGGIYDHGKGK